MNCLTLLSSFFTTFLGSFKEFLLLSGLGESLLFSCNSGIDRTFFRFAGKIALLAFHRSACEFWREGNISHDTAVGFFFTTPAFSTFFTLFALGGTGFTEIAVDTSITVPVAPASF